MTRPRSLLVLYSFNCLSCHMRFSGREGGFSLPKYLWITAKWSGVCSYLKVLLTICHVTRSSWGVSIFATQIPMNRITMKWPVQGLCLYLIVLTIYHVTEVQLESFFATQVPMIKIIAKWSVRGLYLYIIILTVCHVIWGWIIIVSLVQCYSIIVLVCHIIWSWVMTLVLSLSLSLKANKRMLRFWNSTINAIVRGLDFMTQTSI